MVSVLALLLGCGTEPEITWHADVQPIIGERCVGCHFGGSVTPFHLEDYDSAFAVREQIASAVASRRMPPFPADPDCRDYTNDWTLTDEQIATITDWVADGAPEGDPEGIEPVVPATNDLTRIDGTLAMSEPYTPTVEPDEYRCFVLDWPHEEIQFVTGYDVRPGDLTSVHHVILYIIEPDDVAAYEALDAEDPESGYACFGGPGATTSDLRWMGGWAPGGLGGNFKTNLGYPVWPDSKVVMQVHYHPTGTPQPDLTEVDLRLDRFVTQPAVIQPFTNPLWPAAGGMDIAAGDAAATHEFSYTADSEFLIHGGNLHMHEKGTASRFWVERASGEEECMIDIGDWDFGWQLGYGFSEVVHMYPGDQLKLECEWDNSTGEATDWGDGTGDEMCLGTMVVSEP